MMERINHMVENLNDLQIFVKRIEKEYGDRIAYRYLAEDSIIDKTFAELAKDIHAVASWLIKNGCSGKHIAIIGSTSYYWVTAFLGILCSANVVVPVDKMLSSKEILNILEMGDVDTVFVSEEFAHLSEAIRQNNWLRGKTDLLYDHKNRRRRDPCKRRLRDAGIL